MLRSNPTNQNKRKLSSNSPKHQCKGCGASFKSDPKLLNHMKKIPSCEAFLIKCVGCSRKFTSVNKLNGHLKNFNNKKCNEMHNQHYSSPHEDVVMDAVQNTARIFPVVQAPPVRSNTQNLGYNYIRGIQDRFVNGDIGLDDIFPHCHEIDASFEVIDARIEQANKSNVNDSSGNQAREKPTSTPDIEETVLDRDIDEIDEDDSDNDVDDDEVMDDEPGEEVYIDNNQRTMDNTTEERIPIHQATQQTPRSATKQYNITKSDLIDRCNSLKATRTNLRVDSNLSASLKLQDILHKSNSPLGLYDKIMNWAYSHKGDLYEYESNCSHDQLVEVCSKKLFGGEKKEIMGLHPSTQHIKLPTGREVDITTFSFRKMVTHLLSDYDLMKWENLIFESLPGNEFHVETGNPNQSLGDIHTGSWFADTYAKIIESLPIRTNGRRRILCPIIFYIDGLVLDAYGKLSLEPLTFTLGLFKREIRNLSKAWRTLGFMEDLDALYGANLKSALEKANDYHAILSCILEEFKQVQGLNEPMEFDLEIEGEMHQVELVFEVAWVIGDCKGLDMLAGRKMSHQCAGLTRDCDCKKIDGDNPDVMCKLLKYDTLKEMTDAELEEISFRRLDPCNAFEGISWGANDRGINGATPPDCLHTILKGGPIESAILSINSELPKQARHMMDKMAGKIAVLNSRQSDRDFPSMSPFRTGLSKVNKLTADEIYAKAFMYYLVFNDTSFAEFVTTTTFRLGPTEVSKKKQFTQDDYKKAHRGLEIVLCFYKWVTKPNHPRWHFVGGRDSIANKTCREFLREFLANMPRHNGDGHRRPKIHFQLHWAFWILMFGCAQNFDSARCECIAGENVKKHSQKTQKRAISLNYQTATRLAEEMVLSDMRKYANIEESVNASSEKVSELLQDDKENGMKCGSRFLIEFDLNSSSAKLKWLKRNINESVPDRFNSVVISSVSARLQSFAVKEFGNTHLNGRTEAKIVSIEGFTELKKFLNDDSDNMTTFRSIPSYRDGRPWKDWAAYKWSYQDENGDEHVDTLEGRIEMFLDYSTMNINLYESETVPTDDNVLTWDERFIRKVSANEIEENHHYPGKYICVTTSVHENHQNEDVYNFMTSNISTRKKCKEQLCFAATTSIEDKCFVITENFYNDTIIPKDVVVYDKINNWGDMIMVNNE